MANATATKNKLMAQFHDEQLPSVYEGFKGKKEEL